MKTMRTWNNSREKTPERIGRNPQIHAANGQEEARQLNPPRIRRRKIPKYLKILMGALGVYIAVLFLVGGYQLWQLKKQVDMLELEQKALITQQEIFKGEMESLNTPEMIEKIARESLRMVKPGETVIIPAANN